MTISSKPVGHMADIAYQRAQQTIEITRKYHTPKRAYRELLEAMFHTPLEQSDVRAAYAEEAARLIFAIGQEALYDSLPYTEKARGLFSDAVRFYEARSADNISTELLVECKLELVKTTLIVMKEIDEDETYWAFFDDVLKHMSYVIAHGERVAFEHTLTEITSIIVKSVDQLRSNGQLREARVHFERIANCGIAFKWPKGWAPPPPSRLNPPD